MTTTTKVNDGKRYALMVRTRSLYKVQSYIEKTLDSLLGVERTVYACVRVYEWQMSME